MTDTAPLVSCLTVTLARADRLEHLRRGLLDYCRQTFPRREMVLVPNGGTPAARQAILDIVAGLGRPDIKVIDVPDGLTLGALRNIALDAARGDLVCTWDDDDFSHPLRLEKQVAILSGVGARAVCLTEMMQFFPAERRLYLTNWAATPPGANPGSLMWTRTSAIRYPEIGAEATLGEDLAVIRQLRRLGGFHGIGGAPNLYVYVSHGSNICGQDHHRMLVERLAVSRGILRRREGELRAGLAAFDFGPGPVVVEGNNGPAFTLAG